MKDFSQLVYQVEIGGISHRSQNVSLLFLYVDLKHCEHVEHLKEKFQIDLEKNNKMNVFKLTINKHVFFSFNCINCLAFNLESSVNE